MDLKSKSIVRDVLLNKELQKAFINTVSPTIRVKSTVVVDEKKQQ
jgi:hypothetical protein